MKSVRQAQGKIGIFDSGVGGLLIAKAIRKKLPQYDYVYLGDTKRVPYGGRSHDTVYEFTRQAVDYLFKEENCTLVILACNTASARALRRIQREYLPSCAASGDNFSFSRTASQRRLQGKVPPEATSLDRKVLGVLIPAAEEAGKYKRVGVLATRGTVASNTFVDEIKKVLARRNLDEGGNLQCHVIQNPAPMLVPLAEEGIKDMSVSFIKMYLKPFMSNKVDAVVLGCTHYPFFKKEFKRVLGPNVKLVSQDDVVPKKLLEYLSNHPEVESGLSQKSSVKLLFTDITPHVSTLSKKWFQKDVKPKLINL